MARTKKATVLDDLTRRVDKAQTRATKVVGQARHQAERTLEKGWKATLEALPPPARKVVKEATGRIEKAATDLDKRRAHALKVVERQGKDLFGRLSKERRTLRSQLVKQRKELTALVSDRTKELTARLEKRTAQLVRPIVRALDLASRSDIERLSKRVSVLERRTGRKARHAAAA